MWAGSLHIIAVYFFSSALYGLWLNLEVALSAHSPLLPCSGLINFVGITLVVAIDRLF